MQEPVFSFKDAHEICLKQVVNASDYQCIELVYGFAGKYTSMYFSLLSVDCIQINTYSYCWTIANKQTI